MSSGYTSAVPVKPEVSRLLDVQEKHKVQSVSRIKARLKMPPRTSASNRVMQSGCSMVNTAKRTEWCSSSRLTCSTALDGDLMLMKTNLKFDCFQEEPKSSFFSPNNFYYVMLFVMLQFDVIVDIFHGYVWFPQKPISVTWICDSFTVTKALTELLQGHCVYSFSVLSNKGDIWMNSLSNTY